MDSHQRSERAIARLEAVRKIRHAIEELRDVRATRFQQLIAPKEKQPSDVLASHLPECDELHDIAMAASEVLAGEQATLDAQQQFVNALTEVEAAAWDAYFDCESP